MSFGIAMNKKSRVQVCTPQLMAQALDSPQTARACAAIADALEACRRGELTREEFEAVKREQKDGLQCFCFHATFRNGRRISAEAVPSGLCIYDIDHIPNPQGWWEAIEPRCKELGIVLVHITPSGEGCRLVFYTPRGMSLPQAQAWMAQQVGDREYDTSVSDLSRCSFAVPREYVLFLDEEGLFSVIQSEAKNLGNTKVGENVDAPEILPPYGRLDDKNDAPDDKNSKEYPSTYEGIPYGNIVQVLEEQMGGEPEHGSRNNFIFAMACHLRHVCNDDPEWIAQLLPTYGEGREKWMATLRSACARVQTKQMPRIMQRTLHICKMQAEGYAERGTGQVPPPLPRKLPPLIKLLVGPQPDIYKPAVCHAVFPALAAHLKGVYFCYIDNILHEATLSCVLAADTGAGKNCVNAPIDRILADIRRRDAENLRREKEWKTEMNTKGANKDKRARPEGLVIQEVDADMTNAAFVQRMAEADGHFLYTKMNEIDQFDALKTSARSKAHFQIMCLAFDPGNTYGQTRVGTASISERVCIRFNWNASTTVRKLKVYFRNVLTDGPISRINFCTIPKREIGAEMPVFGSYDEEFAEKLRPYIERLREARGTVKCPQAAKLARRMVEECAEFARLSQSRVYENLSYRACVIAFLKAMVLYVANDYRWDKSIEEFVRWSLQYDLWCKMNFFGEAIEEQEAEEGRSVSRGPQNLLDLLPDVFTREEAAIMMRRMHVRSDAAAIICNWKRRGYIELYGENMLQTHIAMQRYAKTEQYLKEHPNNDGL